MFDLGEARTEVLDCPVMVVGKESGDDAPTRSILETLKPRVQVQFVGDCEGARQELGLTAADQVSGPAARIRPAAVVLCASLEETAAEHLIGALKSDPVLSLMPVLVVPRDAEKRPGTDWMNRYPHLRVLDGTADARSVRKGLTDLGMAWLLEETSAA